MLERSRKASFFSIFMLLGSMRDTALLDRSRWVSLSYCDTKWSTDRMALCDSDSSVTLGGRSIGIARSASSLKEEKEGSSYS